MNEIRFNDIYRNYVDIVLKTAMHYCGDKEMAEDIVQLTFAKLYVSYDKIENKEAVEAWLITTARYQAFNQIRTMKREVPVDDIIMQECIKDTEPGADEVIFMMERQKRMKEFADELLDALYKHNPRWYDAVIKSYSLDMPQKAIAEEMGIRLEAFQSMLFRARTWIIRKYETQYRKIE